MGDEGSGAGLPRRQLLQGGLAAAAVGSLATAADALPEARAAADEGGAIDIHAHYFPQGFLDVLAEVGKPFGFDYRPAADGFFIGAIHYQAKGDTHPVAVVDALGLGETEREMVLRGTAARILRV